MRYVSNFFKVILFFCFTLFVIGCKNYYNETIKWIDNIEPHTNIEIVKESQPEFVRIDWGYPEKKDNENWYYIQEINGSYDVLRMSHILVFIDNEFDRRESHK
ncbi:hypothetical protein [Winogradskyella thalassocola]|uniref:Lipoprotein n=1 Tax=Winogradskyella thalassocola TaxID=262004 RepID=A0A1G8H5S5_9FLAO|nr:hypothetical protein [Winogradskyella thalassocola]SDI02027.1 hypothetical protein SAMN04489796_106139 [Winogradskyella thalassocola]